MRKLTLLALTLIFSMFTHSVAADERYFTYAYQADVLGEGETEFEQWITNQSDKKDSTYSAWNFRSEIEHGITKSLMTAFYLNWDSVRAGSENETTFKGISSEWVYQLLNPTLDPVGLALYGEYTTDGIDHELEGKILLSKHLGDFELVANAVYEAENEEDDGEREKEATIQFVMGGAYHFTPHWTGGFELRNKSAYPGGFNLDGQEYQTWSVGPVIHYGSPKWWATLTVLPQVWGNGDGSDNGRQLEHEEGIETRLLVGVNL